MSEANVRVLTRAETQDLDASLAKFRQALKPPKGRDHNTEAMMHVLFARDDATVTSIGDMIEGRTIQALRFMRDCLAIELGLDFEDLPFDGDIKRYAEYLSQEGERATYEGYLAWQQGT